MIQQILMKKKNKIIALVVGALIIIGAGIYGVARESENLIYFYLSHPEQRLASLRISENLFIKKYQPLRNWEIQDPILEAQSAVAVEKNNDRMRTLFSKNAQHPFAIASLTKLMTAMVVVDHYSLNKTVVISKTAVAQQGESGLLKPGDKWKVQDLLRMSLMESSNDAAYALAETMGLPKFVQAMNEKAALLHLRQTRFINPTGLEDGSQTNVASGQDLVKIVSYLLDNSSYKIINEIIGCHQFKLYTIQGHFHHTIVNSNNLLGKLPYLVGGKTGYLPNYGGSLITIFKQPQKDNYLITVVLDSPKRFSETEQLVQWVSKAYFHIFNYYGLPNISRHN